MAEKGAIQLSSDQTFKIELKNFYVGESPGASINSLTELGNAGHASFMQNADILTPDYITQGPALANLTNGTQAGAVSELINFIMDKAVAASQTYGVGVTKLFKITPTAVSNTGIWPHTITGATDGTSCIDLMGSLFYFYNKSSGAEIGKFDLSSTFDDDWGSTTPTGAAALQKAPHPVAKKEDIMVFGNGQYAGTYIVGTNTLAPTKLDFGNGQEVADVIFHANQWWIAVNGGVSGTNRTTSEIYLYDGGASSSILSDETGVGVQRIGFLFIENGIVFVAYQDLTFTAGYKIGYIAGRAIKPLASFSGTLPNYQQKTLFKNTLLFISNALVRSAGAVIPELPYQISQLADGGYATVGAMAAPFGTPMIASSDGSTNHRLAKFSGFDVNCLWRSIVIQTMFGRKVAYIDEIVVITGTLLADARCDLLTSYNQASSVLATAKQITGTGKRRHVFNIGQPDVEDIRIDLDWSEGDETNDCPIRKIIVHGHFLDK